MALLLKNNAVSRLAGAITNSQTTLTVTTGEGSKFPAVTGSDYFPLTLVKVDGTLEIMKCTGRAGDILTVTRAQEGTSGLAFDSGDRVELRVTAETLLTFFSPFNMGAGSGLDAETLLGKTASSSNVINTLVTRDGSGNFSAGTITATLNGNATTATSAGSAGTAGSASTATSAGTAGTATNQSGGTVNATSAHANVYTESTSSVGASNIDVSLSNNFTKTISGATTLTVSNVPTTGTMCAFTLELLNAGSNITWWAGIKWAGGVAPVLTATGTDVLSFRTRDGGATWMAFVLGLDMQ